MESYNVWLFETDFFFSAQYMRIFANNLSVVSLHCSVILTVEMDHTLFTRFLILGQLSIKMIQII